MLWSCKWMAIKDCDLPSNFSFNHFISSESIIFNGDDMLMTFFFSLSYHDTNLPRLRLIFADLSRGLSGPQKYTVQFINSLICWSVQTISYLYKLLLNTSVLSTQSSKRHTLFSGVYFIYNFIIATFVEGQHFERLSTKKLTMFTLQRARGQLVFRQ